MIANLLVKFGFDLPLLSSEHYALQKIEQLGAEEVEQIKHSFVEYKHPRFKKEFPVSRHQPFGKSSDYVKCVENADSAKIAKLAKLVGMLPQTKTCLFRSI